MAIAAVWTMSTARSPITWHPNIWQVLRSTINLQKPSVRPSTIVRVVEVESNDGGHNIVRLTGFDLAEPNLGVLRVCEAANRTDAILKRDGRTSNRVSRGDEAVVDGLRDEHQPSGDIPRREDIGRSCLKVFVNLHVLTLIELDAGRSKIQRPSVSDPTYRNDRQRRLSARAIAVLGEIHPHACRRLLEQLDCAEILAHHNAQLAESGGDDRRYLFLLGQQNPWASLKELDTRAERMEDRGDLNTGVTGADNKH